jgi:hypothetical protein
MPSAPEATLRLGRSTVLLGALAFLIVITPVLRHSGLNPIVVSLSSALVLLAAVYTAFGRRRHVVIALMLAVPALGLQIEEPLLGTTKTVYARLASTAGLLFYASSLILSALMKQRRVSGDTVIGGINVYLLILMGFTYLHAIAELHTPGAYLAHGLPFSEVHGVIPQGDSIETLRYFSAVTMTTLGYGDVTPNAPASLMLSSVQAVVGQLYLAVFVARLVALHIVHNPTGAEP